MLSAIVDTNVAVAALLQRHGGIVTDRDYLALWSNRTAKKKEDPRLLPLVARVANANPNKRR
eukprot:CAMPEP_0113585110 /NCGR_PEP_ID=MMETSP0015_2-20120614/33497_1 /TAXON_ID=2838 /ORGANISM="Odontella" /LENGTH=61 /DNA_ID=CAMNT_0000490275 /DNA_START=9 /DNA_END=191 /DNA_ORIENTATION=+ /assembly_acc=CAM_ASM_000160